MRYLCITNAQERSSKSTMRLLQMLEKGFGRSFVQAYENFKLGTCWCGRRVTHGVEKAMK